MARASERASVLLHRQFFHTGTVPGTVIYFHHLHFPWQLISIFCAEPLVVHLGVPPLLAFTGYHRLEGTVLIVLDVAFPRSLCLVLMVFSAVQVSNESGNETRRRPRTCNHHSQLMAAEPFAVKPAQTARPCSTTGEASRPGAAPSSRTHAVLFPCAHGHPNIGWRLVLLLLLLV